MVGSFYDPALDEGCAFEELISFHGGIGGQQTRPFLLYPAHLPMPGGPIVGAAAVNVLLREWRSMLNKASRAGALDGGGSADEPAERPLEPAAD
jgi:hypothetical protein